ncbi:hypothetical protein Mal15_65720 [Stieleria maiorica]|uniref:Uncharacterized protein n=1 Tax=Stieleria maiorica TaxID=2795974 RepID=A0A5B9MQE8_9BACT|nr:hypothetical protein [Stieleria maiorica]QEG02451.1 hypothetical protein Mal15_65720 [Stieleria maiorica]
MRFFRDSFFIVLFGFPFVSAGGCGGSNEPTMAPRTEEQIQAYKEDVYAAEEADSAAAEEE